LHIQRDAVETDPTADADADGGDLVLAQCAAGAGAVDPDADAALAPLALHAEFGERLDQPFLEAANEAAHVATAPGEVEHHIGHALPGAVIGRLAAAAGADHRETLRVENVAVLCAGAGGVERGVLDQPDELPRLAAMDRRGATLHRRDCGVIGGQAGRNGPLDSSISRYLVHARRHPCGPGPVADPSIL